MLTNTKILLIVLIVLIICIYGQHYSKYAKGYEINQTTLDKISLDLLYERNPIIISESLKRPRQLLWTLFKYSYAFKKEYTLQPLQPVKTNAKFSYLFPSKLLDQDSLVNLVHPTFAKAFEWKKYANGVVVSTTQLQDTKVEYITIKLRPSQVAIIPSHWIAETSSSGVVKIDMDDVLSAIYFKVVGK